MKPRTIATIALLLASGVGCGKQGPSEPAPERPAPAPAAASSEAPAPTEKSAPLQSAAAQEGEDIAAGEAVEETGQAPPANAAADQANIMLAKAFASPGSAGGAADPASKWTQGTHYQVVTPAQPTSVPPDKVEVLEMFWYGCPHCYGLEPYIESWEPKKASFIQFIRVPVTWGPVHKLHARLYYTLQTLNRSDLHLAAFRESQVGNHLIGRDMQDTERVQLDFAKRHGIDGDAFTKAYRSEEVTGKLERAEELIRRYKIEGVPRMVVNGKYTADVASAGGQSQLISLVSDLAAREHKKN